MRKDKQVAKKWDGTNIQTVIQGLFQAADMLRVCVMSWPEEDREDEWKEIHRASELAGQADILAKLVDTNGSAGVFFVGDVVDEIMMYARSNEDNYNSCPYPIKTLFCKLKMHAFETIQCVEIEKARLKQDMENAKVNRQRKSA